VNNIRGYTDDAINKALRLADGSRRVSFRYDLLNQYDVKIGDLDGVTSANISYGDLREIKRSATMTINDSRQKDIDFLSDQIQPWFVLHMPDGGAVEWPLGIFRADFPARERGGTATSRNVGLCDKLLVIKQDKMSRRFFLEKKLTYVEAVTRILNEAGITKINIPATQRTLPADREYPIGTKKNHACNELLREINYTSLWVDEYGVMRSEPYVPPSQRTITHVYDTTKGDSVVVLPTTEKLDIADRPNEFIRVALNIENEKELVSIFVNNDITSPLSTVRRGRTITDHKEIEAIGSQEALDALVHRVAEESTMAFEHVAFSTVLMPTHGNAETLLLIYPDFFEGPTKLHETSWEMPLTYDGVMQHGARRVVRL